MTKGGGVLQIVGLIGLVVAGAMVGVPAAVAAVSVAVICFGLGLEQ